MTFEALTRRTPLTDLGEAVDKRLWALQRLALNDEPSARARLARLRRAIQAEPGTIPEVWSDTLEVVPQGWRGFEAASPAERSAHVAVTLYALHQQGKGRAMHVAGGSLGSAARTLAIATDREDAVRRRFQAVALSDNERAVTYHLRSLVSLLRTTDTPLDYGRLADDLCDLFGRRRAERVRLRWGRDFSIFRKSTENDAASPSEDHNPLTK